MTYDELSNFKYDDLKNFTYDDLVHELEAILYKYRDQDLTLSAETRAKLFEITGDDRFKDVADLNALLVLIKDPNVRAVLLGLATNAFYDLVKMAVASFIDKF